MKHTERKNNSRFRLADLFIVILCLSVMTCSINLFRLDLFQTINQQNEKPVGAVIIKNNIVQRRAADRVLWDRPRVASPVYLGDLIRTAGFSAATLDIEGQQIDIDENTFIRIQRSLDGSGALQIELTEGSIGVTTGKDSGGLQLSVMGRVVKTGAGTVIAATAGKNGTAVEVSKGTADINKKGESREVASGTIITLDADGTQRLEPAAAVAEQTAAGDGQAVTLLEGERLSEQERLVKNELPLEAETMFMELSPEAETAFTELSPEAETAFMEPEPEAETALIKPEPIPKPEPTPPPVPLEVRLMSPARGARLRGLAALREQTVFTWDANGEVQSSRFVLSRNSNPLRGQPAVEINNPGRAVRLSRLEEGVWYWTVEARAVHGLVSAAEPRQLQVLPIPLLPAPGNFHPANGYLIGIEQLKTQRNIVFGWSTVSGANAYVFTLYEQTAKGRRRINRVTVRNAGWTLENVSTLGRGTFVWQVEAVNRNADGTIEQHGRVSENNFTIDVPSPHPVQMEDPGILYDY
jgi:hypothetical protein